MHRAYTVYKQHLSIQDILIVISQFIVIIKRPQNPPSKSYIRAEDFVDSYFVQLADLLWPRIYFDLVKMKDYAQSASTIIWQKKSFVTVGWQKYKFGREGSLNDFDYDFEEIYHALSWKDIQQGGKTRGHWMPCQHHLQLFTCQMEGIKLWGGRHRNKRFLLFAYCTVTEYPAKS